MRLIMVFLAALAKAFYPGDRFFDIGERGLKLGIMVGLRDFGSLRVEGSDFSELLLFDGDLDAIDDETLAGLVSRAAHPITYVHVQEFLTSGGRNDLLDLSSRDPDWRRASVEAIRRTKDLSTALGGLPVVIHPGGITPSESDHESLMSCLEESLDELGRSMLLLENMPWYYWYRKEERRVAGLCVHPSDLERVEGKVEGFTLDTCHGYLSRPEGAPGFCEDFLDRFGDKVLHIHASDARAPDQEGMQIGEGDVDFSVLRGEVPPVLVEIWGGHSDGGAGFRVGVERLRSLEASWR
jgi:sugar phosphate isomerase/epimerase